MDPSTNAAQNLEPEAEMSAEELERIADAEGARQKAELLLAEQTSAEDVARATEVEEEVKPDEANPLADASDEEIDDVFAGLS